MRLTVAIPLMHRSSLEAALSRELRAAVHWCQEAPADVVLALPGPGLLAHCPAWPGPEGAAALVAAGFQRLQDQRDLGRLNEVGRALASEQDLDRLLDLILTHARSLLEAEAGSLYLVVAEEGQAKELLFAHTQNAQVSLPFNRRRMAITSASMAGFVAETGASLNLPDVYQVPPAAPYRFNDAFDRQTGYRTRSMLAVPIRDNQGEILGVLQLLNRLEGDPAQPVPFLEAHEHLAQSLAGQAGVAIRNANLIKQIQRMFRRFVDASVQAIEQRDPVTQGHSKRVADLTVHLAEAVNRVGSGPLGPLHFSAKQIREIEYASLLHDFGKVGVREQVLVKQEKLLPARLEVLLQRLRQRGQEALLRSLRQAWAEGRPFDPGFWEALAAQHDREAEEAIALVQQSNRPTVLAQDTAAGLDRLEALTFTRWNGAVEPVLEPEDLLCLRIRRGSLSEDERRQIESHVTHTKAFLDLIPWTEDLRRVPAIAFGHHERLNGMGYPKQLKADEILPESRALAISDVFDALTAQDRPYKKAVPLEKSLDILHQDARDGHLDPDLLAVFVEARVFEVVTGQG